ncbi:alternative splicing regulator-domain-containing protein [Zychaea mexicana]|uniref:alternative splicing regulator-domain-containing protein n=1 Tax=Zychaea mexicana TaxID=64656 RepID=UPI0022FEF05D|nr:alternative splicing regulator-domain-containing protein [Zychaea mexicana]KAI9477124.1 alternative splicing regulator-domain-containing protein [Zychaea mexicana]
MWHEARANEKKIKEIMVDHKKRAERRRAFYESRLGDPKQLLRVIGSSTKLYPDAEQYYYHENQDNLMPWQGNTDIRIDRFDGRSLLDFVPEKQTKQRFPNKEQHMMDELNFERYHDLVEAERLGVSEQERLTEVEEEWTKLLERHKALLAMLNNNRKPEKGYAFDYGTPAATNDEMDNEEESQLLKEADILQYVDELTDKDKMILNDMAGKFGIRNYTRLLRMTKRDRDEQLRELKAKVEMEGNQRIKVAVVDVHEMIAVGDGDVRAMAEGALPEMVDQALLMNLIMAAPIANLQLKRMQILLNPMSLLNLAHHPHPIFQSKKKQQTKRCDRPSHHAIVVLEKEERYHHHRHHPPEIFNKQHQHQLQKTPQRS